MRISSTWNAYISIAKDFINYPHFNYIRGDSPIDCIYPLSSVIALCSAKIHESHLGSWAKISALDQTRVKVVDSVIELKGPVWIVAGTAIPRAVKISGVGFSALIGGFTVGLITHKVQARIQSSPQKQRERKSSSHLPVALGLIAGIGSGVMASKLLGKIIPATRGIFFYNLPL